MTMLCQCSEYDWSDWSRLTNGMHAHIPSEW